VAALERRRRELALPLEDEKFFFLTPQRCVELMRPFAELGGGDFLLAAYAPYDWESLELFARDVAPALRA
jgi:alkanesulfonate monooxygenase SsuD/methylene tetrahydromethanopterin reductase-like flavin-dependent oxidoreductase (luciferase family)